MYFDYFFFFSFDHPHIIAGQGSIAIEIMEQMKEVDAIVVPVGGGSIIAGVCAYMSKANPKCKIIVSKKILVESLCIWFIGKHSFYAVRYCDVTR